MKELEFNEKTIERILKLGKELENKDTLDMFQLSISSFVEYISSNENFMYNATYFLDQISDFVEKTKNIHSKIADYKKNGACYLNQMLEKYIKPDSVLGDCMLVLDNMYVVFKVEKKVYTATIEDVLDNNKNYGVSIEFKKILKNRFVFSFFYFEPKLRKSILFIKRHDAEIEEYCDVCQAKGEGRWN